MFDYGAYTAAFDSEPIYVMNLSKNHFKIFVQSQVIRKYVVNSSLELLH